MDISETELLKYLIEGISYKSSDKIIRNKNWSYLLNCMGHILLKTLIMQDY